MSQEKTAEIIDLGVSRAVAAGDHAGGFLQAARMNAGLGIEDVAAATKIKPEHVIAIEQGDAAALPATPYAVGFVRVYAAYLGLDAEGVAAEFRKELTRARPDPGTPRSTAPLAEPSDGIKVLSLIGVVMVLAFAIWIGFQIAGNAERQDGANAQPGPRITVSDQRAETPRPRIVVRPQARGDEYDVMEIPDALSAEDQVEASADGAVDGAALSGANAPAATNEAPASGDADASVQPISASAPVEQSAGIDSPVEEPAVAQPAPANDPVDDPVVVEARLKRSIGPEYPGRCARDAEALESVSLIFDVTIDGRPTNAKVTNATNECFNNAAVAAIMKWRFDPRTVGGAATTQAGLQATLNFRK